MTAIIHPRKACAVNPLKTSAPLGGAMAFLGIDGSLPLFHGSQGCTAFALVLMVRHFREAIPLQTTAMNEITTIMGGTDNLEQAIDNIYKRARPKLIGICSTALTATRGEDVPFDLGLIRERHPEWEDLEVVFADTPDYSGSLQDGWAKAVTALVEALVEPMPGPRARRRINVLAGSHLTAGDIEEIRDFIEAFGLSPIILPDLSGSLDGHVPDRYIPTSLGGTTIEDVRRMGRSALTLALGEQMRPAAEALERKAGVPFKLIDRLTGLNAIDALVVTLMEASGTTAPEKIRRRRSQLADAMLDGHFYFGGKRIAIAAEPDLLFALTSVLTELGAIIATAVTTGPSPVLERVPAATVVIGDLDDLEAGAADCDLMIAHTQARQAAERSGVPLWRAGFPTFDRLGSANRSTVGYRGTRDLIFELGNIFIDHQKEHGPDHWRDREEDQDAWHNGPQAAAG